MTRELERRFSNKAEIELRNDGGVVGLRGYAALYDTDSLPIGGVFVERIAQGTFTSALGRNPDVRALINHDPARVLARTASGTLQLRNTSKGLLVDIPALPDRTDARDLAESVKRGDVSQMSFGFICLGDTWSERVVNGKQQVVRELTDIELIDVSAVTFPAYPETELGLRSAVDSAKRFTDRQKKRGQTVSRLLLALLDRAG